jgi:hypothetical protein
LGTGNWASTIIWGRVQKQFAGFPLNSYLAESTLNFRRLNYAYTRIELVDKDELFPNAATHPAYRIGAYTFGGVRDFVHTAKWNFGIGSDVTFYSKPGLLDQFYGDNPVSLHVFIRIRPV